MNFLTRLLITALVAFGLSYLLPGVHMDSFIAALILALVLALLNTLVKPAEWLVTDSQFSTQPPGFARGFYNRRISYIYKLLFHIQIPDRGLH